MSARFSVDASASIGIGVTRLVVDAPRVAASARAGQFVIVRASAHGERIPLTIADADPATGSIVLVVQSVGRSTAEISALEVGDHFEDVLGPLGKPTEIADFGTCVVVAGGVGIAIALPVANALHAAGNHVIGLVGARTAHHLILLDEMREACDSLAIATEDGSAGRRGLITTLVDAVLGDVDIARVFVVGPVPMMKAVSELTRSHGTTTIASLNPLMVDGTGMCGGCRVSVAGRTRFACVDGPEFDAHEVDFDLLARRNQAYEAFERCHAAMPPERNATAHG